MQGNFHRTQKENAGPARGHLELVTGWVWRAGQGSVWTSHALGKGTVMWEALVDVKVSQVTAVPGLPAGTVDLPWTPRVPPDA